MKRLAAVLCAVALVAADTVWAADFVGNVPIGDPNQIAGIDPSSGARIKDITTVQGVRENQLIGYGLVIGLQGTGDSMRNSPFTGQALESMLDRLGINVSGAALRARNVAGVTVTANLPAFAGRGGEIDVNVASIGDATSLKGGTLLMTPLSAGDGEVYAVAQGPVAVSGLSVGGEAETVTQGVPTVGRIPNGAIVEREVPGSMEDLGELVLVLNNPDFKTAAMMADAVNAYTSRQFGRSLAVERDLRSVVVRRPAGVTSARFMAAIGQLRVAPDTPARVVVDQRTGTVVIGSNVQISQVALTHGNLTVRVTEMPQVSQPEPFSDGQTVVTPLTQVDATEEDGHLAIIGGTDLKTLVHGLNQIGLKPSDIIAILQAIKTSGALQGELVVQ
ncbi:flagellar basal body P-ring protein FlgI [Afifella marina]|uniref:Flagellar P-ring protein n=1 Tax=Afifella marina DSM 2698 TaxID=1120955 RepID=A0A1G5MUN1_AFIMA|nr:flagellar basal body P-ring protein FlgI [Afifella marina]MBK1622039.1 flagellar biosynthesis protein FlgI [Afifella marina DSM 2698]MBK1627832.1 flagellar biosynthesis protein FlgI [Afifella marina]MBK5916799.1 flagellar biosynthesis protein FlgI [Afifella marina]RAI19876.1 flagellar biosynthesis protein FlgI [Afifella marina DSM 2698]SCZ28967.1 flagellar P-ring protein precursor FlgI [Afifella marina DSM 2698]